MMMTLPVELPFTEQLLEVADSGGNQGQTYFIFDDATGLNYNGGLWNYPYANGEFINLRPQYENYEPYLFESILGSCMVPDPASAVQLICIGVSNAPQVLDAGGTQNVPLGSTASLHFNLNGQAPFSFQWLMDNTNMPGETGDSLVLSNITTNSAADYSCLISYAFGEVKSPTITIVPTQPSWQ